MSDLPKIFYVVNDGESLTAYRKDDDFAWFTIERAKCAGKDAAHQAESFNEAVKFIRTGFGPLAEYRELHAPVLALTTAPQRAQR